MVEIKPLKAIKNSIKKRKAKNEIGSQVFKLLENIYSRYSRLSIYDGSENERLSRLIMMVDQDPEISRLNSLNYIGSIDVLLDGEKTIFGGFGTNLCIDEKGLFIYDWNDHQNKHKRIPATPETLFGYLGQAYSTERLRTAIVDYTGKKKQEN